MKNELNGLRNTKWSIMILIIVLNILFIYSFMANTKSISIDQNFFLNNSKNGESLLDTALKYVQSETTIGKISNNTTTNKPFCEYPGDLSKMFFYVLLFFYFNLF